MKKTKKKVKEPVSELFINLFVAENRHYCSYEYTYQMTLIGIKRRELPAAVLELAMDRMPVEFDRLNKSEQDEVEKRLRKYFKEGENEEQRIHYIMGGYWVGFNRDDSRVVSSDKNEFGYAGSIHGLGYDLRDKGMGKAG